ncbi:MAG: response regulator [Planctomycetes bacterium]|nr:response regulator [Planctomycetota bacterium]
MNGPLEGKTILLVDDDPDILTAMTTLMEDTGATVETAVDGNAAIKRAREVDPDVIVLDAMLPKRSGLLVLALSNGHVENRVVECPKDMTLDDLGRANQFLGSTVTGKTLRSLTRFRWDSSDHDRPNDLLAKASSTIRAIAKDLTRGKVIMEGQEYIFAQPEFQRDRAQLELLMKSMQDEAALYEALSSTSKGKTTITIGKENRRETHYTLSILHHSFYVKDERAGAIALVGPTRMNYEVGTRLLNYTAKAITETLTKVLG